MSLQSPAKTFTWEAISRSLAAKSPPTSPAPTSRPSQPSRSYLPATTSAFPGHPLTHPNSCPNKPTPSTHAQPGSQTPPPSPTTAPTNPSPSQPPTALNSFASAGRDNLPFQSFHTVFCFF